VILSDFLRLQWKQAKAKLSRVSAPFFATGMICSMVKATYCHCSEA
jgi:hypothetical protein